MRSPGHEYIYINDQTTEQIVMSKLISMKTIYRILFKKGNIDKMFMLLLSLVKLKCS